MPNQLEPSRRVTYITGGSSGLGEALALAYAKRGHYVVVFARRKAALDSLVQEIEKLGSNGKAYALDVTDRDACLKVFKQAISECGIPDLAIANAGVSLPNTVENFHSESAAQNVTVNILGVLNTFEAILPDMIARKSGHIAVLSSLAAFRALPTMEVYSAAKAALNKICDGFRVQLLAHNIKVTTICPGFIRTPMTEKNAFPQPLQLSLSDGISEIMSAIDRKKAMHKFPKRVYWLIWLSHLLPDRLLEKLTRKGRSKLNRYLARKKESVSSPT